jgi:hypothetical protein
LDKDAPLSRAINAVGRIFGRPVLGGLWIALLCAELIYERHSRLFSFGKTVWASFAAAYFGVSGCCCLHWMSFGWHEIPRFEQIGPPDWDRKQVTQPSLHTRQSFSRSPKPSIDSGIAFAAPTFGADCASVTPGFASSWARAGTLVDWASSVAPAISDRILMNGSL